MIVQMNVTLNVDVEDGVDLDEVRKEVQDNLFHLMIFAGHGEEMEINHVKVNSVKKLS